MGLDSSTHRECPLPRYWGSMGISLCPSGTGGVPTLKSSFLLHLDRKKNCLFQPGNLSLQCLINSVLFTWGCGKCLSGVCGNGHVFGQEHTLVTHRWHNRREDVQPSSLTGSMVPRAIECGEGQEKHVWNYLWGPAWICCNGKGILHLLKEKCHSLLPFFSPSGLRGWTFIFLSLEK